MSADKPDALLLDEMFAPAIADQLSALGVDCRAVAADRALRSHPDLEVFETAVREGRIVVTNNVRDFESLRRAHQAIDNPLPGFIYTCDTAFPRTRTFTTRIVTALHEAAASHAVARYGGILWLSSGTS